MECRWRYGIGQDSHRFEEEPTGKVLRMGGLDIPDAPALQGNSDADVVLHAICNAISSITTVPILGAVADDLCKQGITDSSAYLEAALETLKPENNPAGRTFFIEHLAITIEAKKPKLLPLIPQMRERIAGLCGVSSSDVGIMATTGEGLTDFGRGLGVQCFVALTVREIL